MKVIEKMAVIKAMNILHGRMSCNCTDGFSKFVLLRNANAPCSFDEENGLMYVSDWTVDDHYDFWEIKTRIKR